MAPADQLRRTTVTGSVGSTASQTACSPVVPDHLRPQWGDLPALAWLSVRRLDTKLQAIPVLGRVAAWCAAPLMLLTLICAHADGRLAAQNRHAVVWIRRLSPTGRDIYTRRELLIVAAAFLPPLSVLLAIVIGVDTHSAPLTRIVVRALGVAIVTGLLLAFFAVNRCSDFTTRAGSQHKRLAAQTRAPLVAAQGLVADTTTGAGTRLVRALRVHADRLGVGVAAVARDEDVLRGYLANGFVQTEPDPDGRLLYRPPNAIRHRAPTRKRRTPTG